MLATPANMNALCVQAGEPIAVPGVVAYSPGTDEQYSASPGDYWDQPYETPLTDSVGEPMILARESLTMVEVS